MDVGVVLSELIWLTLLGPLGAATASWRQPRLVTTLLGALVVLAGTIGTFLSETDPLSFRWLPRNGTTLLAAGLQGDLTGALVLLALLLWLLVEQRGLLSARHWLALGAAAISLFSLELCQAFAGLALTSALLTTAPRELWSQRLSDALALVGLAALYNTTGSTGWEQTLLSDSALSILITSLLLGGLGGYLGLAPWSDRASPVLPVAVAAVVLLRLQPMLGALGFVEDLATALAVLSLLLMATDPESITRRACGPLLVLLCCSGSAALLSAAAVATPLLAMLPSSLALAFLAALSGAPMAALASSARWPLLLLFGLGLLLTGRAVLRRPSLAEGTLAAGLLILLGALLHSGVLGLPRWPPPWAVLAAAGLMGVGQLVRSRVPVPVTSLAVLWDTGWRAAVRPLSSRLSAVSLAVPSLLEGSPSGLRPAALSAPKGQALAFGLILLIVTAYAVGASL